MENYQKQITPRRFVYHVSYRSKRASILKKGLIGASSETIGYKDAVFAHNHYKINGLWYPYVIDHWDLMNKDQVNFINDDNPTATDYNYLNYDVWRIDTHQISKKWFVDNVAANDFMEGCEYPFYIVCFGCIPPNALKLVNPFKPYHLSYKRGEVAHVTHYFR